MSYEDSDIPPVVPEGDEFEIISKYTRAQALEDGTLIDVTARAKEAGIKIPTAVTSAVWNGYVELSEAAKKAGNDIEGRLWDIVWMFRCAAVRRPDQSEIRFQLYVVTDRVMPSLVTLKAVVGPGDNGEPVITIMEPEED
jgi:hypothetical protein